MTLSLGVYRPDCLPISIDRYLAATCVELESLGVAIQYFTAADPLPANADLFWDPGTGRPAPHERLQMTSQPLVVTYHGAANVAMSLAECFSWDLRAVVSGMLSRVRTLRGWRVFQGRRFRAIAVSNFAAAEFLRFAPVGPGDVTVIGHGVDHEIFRPDGAVASDLGSFFLHVSSNQPKKNVDRILSAFARLDPDTSPRLMVVAPGYPGRNIPPHVELIGTALNHADLACLYRAAVGFVFPSLHETFGMPIVEAMASGCPVLTAFNTGCAETAGDAALLVNPRSVDEIASALRRLSTDVGLRDTLRHKGLERAKAFSWKTCARRHLDVFESCLADGAAA